MIRGFMGVMLIIMVVVGHVANPHRVTPGVMVLLGVLGVALIISGFRRMDRDDR